MTPAEISAAIKAVFAFFSPLVGDLARPVMRRAMVRLAEEEMRAIAPVMQELATEQGVSIVYKDGRPEMSIEAVKPPTLTQDTVGERAEASEHFRAAKGQENLENVLAAAIVDIAKGGRLADAEPDPSWAWQFSDYARAAPSQAMQELWGKLLAGEMRRPGTFSLRLLRRLHQMTTREAQAFDRVAPYFCDLYSGEGNTLFLLEEVLPSVTTLNLTLLSDLRELEEIGLLKYQTGQPFTSDRTFTLYLEPFELQVRETGTILGRRNPPISENLWMLTSLGKELLMLVTRPDEDDLLKVVESVIKELVARSYSCTLVKRLRKSGLDDVEVIGSYSPATSA